MKRITLIVVALAAVAVLLPSVSRAEPKNQFPFTRPVGAKVRTLAVNEAGHGLARATGALPDRKATGSGAATLQGYTNLGPATAGQSGSLNVPATEPQGEPKNELPFTRPAIGASSAATTSRSGFDWIEGLLVACAAILIAGVAFGAARLVRHASAKPIA